MSLYLDSANLDDVREAANLGFVRGATTNPKLLAVAGHTDFYKALGEICPLLPGTVFYQLVTETLAEMRNEYRVFRHVAPNLGIKIPCTLTGLQFAKEISRESIVAVTAVFTPAQAYLAGEAGARFVIPFVNRISRFTGSGPEVVTNISIVLQGSRCQVLAASIKSASEAVQILQAGAQHISLPLVVIREMAESPLTRNAIDEFNQALKGL